MFRYVSGVGLQLVGARAVHFRLSLSLSLSPACHLLRSSLSKSRYMGIPIFKKSLLYSVLF